MKCNEHEATNFSQSGAKVKDIYRQVERFKTHHKGSKVENSDTCRNKSYSMIIFR